MPLPKVSRPKSQSSLLGAAGEFYVLSQLLRRGFIAAIAPNGVPNCDLIVTDIEGNKLSAIQVKSRRELGTDKGWHMKAKHETILGERLFYAFVNFGKGTSDLATTHIVPSSVVAKVLRRENEHWLATPGKNGRKHNDSDMRRFLPDYTITSVKGPAEYAQGWLDNYLEAWDLIASS